MIEAESIVSTSKKIVNLKAQRLRKLFNFQLCFDQADETEKTETRRKIRAAYNDNIHEGILRGGPRIVQLYRALGNKEALFFLPSLFTYSLITATSQSDWDQLIHYIVTNDGFDLPDNETMFNRIRLPLPTDTRKQQQQQTAMLIYGQTTFQISEADFAKHCSPAVKLLTNRPQSKSFVTKTFLFIDALFTLCTNRQI